MLTSGNSMSPTKIKNYQKPPLLPLNEALKVFFLMKT